MKASILIIDYQSQVIIARTIVYQMQSIGKLRKNLSLQEKRRNLSHSQIISYILSLKWSLKGSAQKVSEFP